MYRIRKSNFQTFSYTERIMMWTLLFNACVLSRSSAVYTMRVKCGHLFFFNALHGEKKITKKINYINVIVYDLLERFNNQYHTLFNNRCTIYRSVKTTGFLRQRAILYKKKNTCLDTGT